jgi:DNA-binding NtrC family response regulator
LVVEDDAGVCELISDILDEADIRTERALSDRDAYAAIPTLPAFMALVVDVNLGEGVTGYDVARFARRVIPEIAVLYISGESSEAAVQSFGVEGSGFLQKPFTPDELLEALDLRLAA